MNPLLSCIVAPMLVFGVCVNTAMQEARGAEPSDSSNTPAGDAVAVVSLSSTVPDEFPKCVGQAILKFSTGIKVISSTWFRDHMFPWFEPGTTPTSADSLKNLMAIPAVERRITQWGVRYVVAVSGDTTTRDGSWGGMYGGGEVAVVVGGISHREFTRLAAVILDLEEARLVDETSASASGSGGAGIVALIPYYIPTPDTESITCETIAKKVIAVIKSESHTLDRKGGADDLS